MYGCESWVIKKAECHSEGCLSAEPERLGPGKCTQPRAGPRRFPAEHPRAGAICAPRKRTGQAGQRYCVHTTVLFVSSSPPPHSATKLVSLKSQQTEEVKQREPPWKWSHTAHYTRKGQIFLKSFLFFFFFSNFFLIVKSSISPLIFISITYYYYIFCLFVCFKKTFFFFFLRQTPYTVFGWLLMAFFFFLIVCLFICFLIILFLSFFFSFFLPFSFCFSLILYLWKSNLYSRFLIFALRFLWSILYI